MFSSQIASLRRLRTWLCAERYFYAKLVASAVAGVLAITIFAGAFLFVNLRDYRKSVTHDQLLEALRTTNKAETELAEVESSYRGFLATGQDFYRQNFARHVTEFQTRLNALRADGGQTAAVEAPFAEWLQTVAKPQLAARDQAQRPPTEAREVPEPIKLALSQSAEARQLALDKTMHADRYADIFGQTLMYTPKLEAAISQMQESKWNYLLSGDAGAMQTYRVAAASFETYYSHLSVLLSERTEQVAMLQQVRAGLETWVRQAAEPELTAKSRGQDILPLLQKPIGRDLMAGVTAKLGKFESQQGELYQRERTKAKFLQIAKAVGLGLLWACAVGVLSFSSWFSFVAYSRHLNELQTAEAQTRSIIETTLDGVITLDDQGVVKSINPAAEKMFLVKAGDVIGKNISKLIPQRLIFHDVVKLSRGSIMAMGQRQGFYTFPIEISLSETQIGHQRQYVAIVRDISERKRSEETLRHIGLGITAVTGEEFLRTLVKQLSKALLADYAFIVEIPRSQAAGAQGILMLSEQGQMRSVQKYELVDTFCESVIAQGYTVVQADVTTRFPEDKLLQELLAVSLIAMPLVDFKGRPVGIMGIIHGKPMEELEVVESTLQIFAARAAAEVERKRFADDLAAEKERLAITLRSIGEAFIATDMEGRVQSINSVAEKLTGWTQEDALGQPLTDVFRLLNERTGKVSNSVVQRILEMGTTLSLGNSGTVVSRAGEEKVIEMNASPIRDKTNRKIGIVLIFRDVTDRKHHEEEMRKAEKLESLGVAAGGIAHDFNNILTAIIGNISLAMMDERVSDSLAQRLITAKKASLRAQDLAQQLLTFAKGGAPIKRTSSIAQLIRDTTESALAGTPTHASFQIPSNLWNCEIDAGQINQVLTNLAANAEQAMPAGGNLVVICENLEVPLDGAGYTTLKPGRYVKILLRDEGIGIPEEYLKKIFDPYFTTKPKGSGLGLATSYSIVKNHGGSITVQSKAGEGAEFTIHLPATESGVALAPISAGKSLLKKAVAAGPPSETKARVLVLDDEEVICALVSAALSPLGYEVVETNSAEDALTAYREALEGDRRFDLVITDLTIPGGMGGLDALKKLREMDPTVRAIVSSGYATDPVMSQYREQGFAACLAKPYEVDALCHLVEEVYARHHETLIYHDFLEAKLA